MKLYLVTIEEWTSYVVEIEAESEEEAEEKALEQFANEGPEHMSLKDSEYEVVDVEWKGAFPTPSKETNHP